MISVTNISKSYGATKALTDISFEIPSGKIAAYVGLNGAGKSTTVKIIAGIEEPDSGSFKVGGLASESELDKIKSVTGYVPENADLFNSLSPVEYFKFLYSIREIPESVAKLRYEYFAELYGFQDMLKQSIGSLSKGNRQKILITSALIHNPDVLLLDEPLNGLDTSSVLIFQSMLKELSANGKTILYCSHLLELLEKVADIVIFLENGVIRMTGVFDELKSKPDYEDLSRLFSNLDQANQRKYFKYDEIFS